MLSKNQYNQQESEKIYVIDHCDEMANDREDKHACMMRENNPYLFSSRKLLRKEIRQSRLQGNQNE